MERRLNLVVTCTNRKRAEAVDELRVSTLPQMEPGERVEAWTQRLKSKGPGEIPASDLYVGNHWYIVRSIIADAAKRRIQLNLWVLSAGYGLIPIDARLHPYAASFAAGPDRVTTPDEAPDWWTALANWPGPAHQSPRTLENLARETKPIPMLVAASAPYVGAVLRDLTAAKDILSTDRLAVISAGFKGDQAIDDVLLTCDARFLDKAKGQGGTAHSLNAKLAAWALEHFDDWGDDFSALHNKFEATLADLVPQDQPKRAAVTDKEVLSFIVEHADDNRRRGHTRLLRDLRASGKACEQKRFKGIYAAFVAGPRP